MNESQGWCWWWNCSFKYSASIFWCFLKSYLDATHGWANWVTPTFAKFLLFFVMPITVNLVSSEGTSGWVSLMITLTVGAFEGVMVQFTLLGLKSWGISFFISFAIPGKVMMMFSFMRTVTLNTFGLLDSTWVHWMSPLLALGNTRIHICTSDNGDIASDIKAPVD